GSTGSIAVVTRLGQGQARPVDRPRRPGRGERDHRARRRTRAGAELMRASVLRDGRMVYRDDVADPVPGPGQVLVAVRACGICGSDLHFAAHGSRVLEMSGRVAGGSGGMDVNLNDDIFMGHEFSAEILEAGPGTETHPAGTLVTSLPVLLSAKGAEPIVYSNNTIGGYAERM